MIRLILHKFAFASEVVSYTRRGLHRPPLTIKVGDKIGNFQLLKSKYYRDFDLTHLQLKDNQNQVKIHQLQSAEENNTASIIFKTQGSSKPALNYALEKMLQCGAKKYPVRNLLSQMNRRSFSLLSPAQTTDEYLMLSFNSPILKDFSNLFDVYSHGLFEPLFREEDFYEVIRRFTYERQTLGLTGQLAAQLYQNQFNIDQQIYSLITERLLGYKSNSLCKPIDLINMKFGELQKYYKETITLANCTILLHGDMNINYFVETYQKTFEKLKPSTNLPLFQVKNEVVKQQVKTVNFQHLRPETILMLSYKIQNATQQQLILLQILSYLLFDMPQSPFMKFNTPQTPYPNLYGFRQRYFNIGITFLQQKYKEQRHMQTAQTFKQRQKLFLQKQKQILKTLQDIVVKKFDNKLIQKCLIHLQNNYHQQTGLSIIQSVVQRVLNGRTLDQVFEVTPLISKLLKNYRKQNIFEELISKFLVRNSQQIVLRGRHNDNIVEEQNRMNHALLAQIKHSLPSSQLNQIVSYSSPTFLQDISLLPEINPSELQIFEQLNGEEIKIKNIKTIYNPKYFGNKLVFKFDLTDIGDEDLPLLALFCKAFPEMGFKNVTDQAYKALIQTYIARIDMNYQTIKVKNGNLKVYVYLTVQFTDRNYQYAFNILNGLLTDFNSRNLTALSRAIHASASNCFNQISQDILHYHALHLASSKSPYAFFQSPISQARTLCSIAGQMKKVTNPKLMLSSLGYKLEEIWQNMMGWSRIQLLWQCHPEKKSFYLKYLNILLSQVNKQAIPPQTIEVSSFPQEKWLKYFPNYQNQLVFEAFSVPYRHLNSPQTLVLSSIINQNISCFNNIGGCFLHKGALVSFIAGGRTKFLQFQQHYKKIDNLNVAKRKIFQQFDRYTVQNQFKSNISLSEARFFKEAVLAVQKDKVQHILNEYILKAVKQGTSSMLALGPRLQNYDPLIKKGWQIERSIDDLSLQMQSLSKRQIKFHPKRYVDIS